MLSYQRMLANIYHIIERKTGKKVKACPKTNS
jgi:hypothetical protein